MLTRSDTSRTACNGYFISSWIVFSNTNAKYSRQVCMVFISFNISSALQIIETFDMLSELNGALKIIVKNPFHLITDARPIFSAINNIYLETVQAYLFFKIAFRAICYVSSLLKVLGDHMWRRDLFFIRRRKNALLIAVLCNNRLFVLC